MTSKKRNLKQTLSQLNKKERENHFTPVAIIRQPGGKYSLKIVDATLDILGCIAHHTKTRIKNNQIVFDYTQLGTAVHYLRMFDYAVFVF